MKISRTHWEELECYTTSYVSGSDTDGMCSPKKLPKHSVGWPNIRYSGIMLEKLHSSLAGR